MSTIARSAEISMAQVDGKIFATDGHVCVVAYNAPAGLRMLTEETRPKLSGVRKVLEEPNGALSHMTAYAEILRWCSPTGKETVSCEICLDEGGVTCDICDGRELLSMDCRVAGCCQDHEDDCCVCTGDGFVDCSCDADGPVRKYRKGIVGGGLFNIKLIWMVLCHLPGDQVRVVPGDATAPLRIYGDGWSMAVMPMRHTKEEREAVADKELKLL
jgi:hypothetical protein